MYCRNITLLSLFFFALFTLNHLEEHVGNVKVHFLIHNMLRKPEKKNKLKVMGI